MTSWLFFDQTSYFLSQNYRKYVTHSAENWYSELRKKASCTNQCPNYYARQRGHDQREEEDRPSLEHSLHDSLSSIGWIFLFDDEHNARRLDDWVIWVVLKSDVFHVSIYGHADQCACYFE